MTALLYYFYGGSECSLNQFIITFNCILCIIVTFVSILPVIREYNPSSGLAQSGMVTIYCTYLIASALSNEPEKTCNILFESGGTKSTSLVIGTIFTFLALAYSTSSVASKKLSSDAEMGTLVPNINQQPSPYLKRTLH